jgi:hypothetical protein
MFQYDMLARSMASGNGFRWYAPPDLARLAPFLHIDPSAMPTDPRGVLTTFRAPLYPAFVAAIYTIFGMGNHRFFAVRVAQAGVGALLAPMTYAAAQRALRPPGFRKDPEDLEWAARAAAWVAAVYPMLLVFPLALATENLFIPLVLASVLALMQLAEAPAELRDGGHPARSDSVHAAVGGVLLGLTALTRSVILPFAGLALVWIWWVSRRARPAMFAGLALLLTVTPWMVRNSLLSHRLTGIETSMGYNLYVGYHPQSTGTFTFGPSLDLLSIIDDRAGDEVGTERALEFIRQDPARFPYLALRRLGYFFNLDLRAFTYFYVNNFLGPISPALVGFALAILGGAFAVLGLPAVWGAAMLPPRPSTILLAVLLGAYLLPHVFVLSEERFHLALIPLFAICTANAWVERKAIPTAGPAVRYAAAIASLFLLANWGFQVAGSWHTLTQMFGSNGNQLFLPY